jgi:hypothetical protein
MQNLKPGRKTPVGKPRPVCLLRYEVEWGIGGVAPRIHNISDEWR